MVSHSLKNCGILVNVPDGLSVQKLANVFNFTPLKLQQRSHCSSCKEKTLTGTTDSSTVKPSFASCTNSNKLFQFGLICNSNSTSFCQQPQKHLAEHISESGTGRLLFTLGHSYFLLDQTLRGDKHSQRPTSRTPLFLLQGLQGQAAVQHVSHK